MSNFLPNMYGMSAIPQNRRIQINLSKPKEETEAKLPSRVIGGLKAQNVHQKIIEIDGKNEIFPSIEYVKALEDDVKMLRIKIKNMEVKNQKFEADISDLKMTVKHLKDSKNERRTFPRY